MQQCDAKVIWKHLRGPVQAGDYAVLGPALIHELPVERQLGTGLDFTAEEIRRKKK